MATVPEGFPTEFQQLKRWVLFRHMWKAGKKGPLSYTPIDGVKRQNVPHLIDGTIDDATIPRNWQTFEDAFKAVLPRKMNGISFVLTAKDGLVCVDLDKCRNVDDGMIKAWAMGIITGLNTYTEISPSGTGLHVWLRGSIPRNLQPKDSLVEIYHDKKAFAMTGERFGEACAIEERDLTELFTRCESGEYNRHKLEAPAEIAEPSKPHEPKRYRAPSLGDDESANDYAIVGALVRAGYRTADDIEAAFAREESQRYAERNKTKTGHKPNWIRYTIDRFLKQERPPATWHQSHVASVESNEPEILLIEKEVTYPDLPDSCLDGRLGEIVQKGLSHCPQAYVYPALLTLAGGAVFASQSEIRTNLYTGLVGGVRTGKTASITQSCEALGFGPPRLYEDLAGSAEMFFDHLESLKPTADPEEVNALLDSGTEPPPMVVVYSPDELKHLLAKAAIKNASFLPVLNLAFSKDRFGINISSGGKGRKHLAVNMRLSIIGGVVEDEFGDLFTSESMGGFYDRFLFGYCPKPYKHFARPFKGKVTEITPFAPDVDPDVIEQSHEWIRSGKIENTRIVELMLRVAYIGAAVDRRKLKAKDLGPALEFGKYQERIRQILAPNPGRTDEAICRNRILAVLRDRAPIPPGEAFGPWLKRRALEQYTNASRDYANVFDRCLQNLVKDEIDYEPHPKRPAVVRLHPKA